MNFAKILNQSLFLFLLNTASAMGMQRYCYVTITNKCSYPIIVFYNTPDLGFIGAHKSYFAKLRINGGERGQSLLHIDDDEQIGLWVADEENNSAELRIHKSYKELIVSEPKNNKNLEVTVIPAA